jgi:hypothetical protein
MAGMKASPQATHAIVKGIGIGLVVALAALASGDSPNPYWARAFDILGAPVAFAVLLLEKLFGLDKGSSVGFWLLFHFAYWGLIGGLMGWGYGVLRSKVLGDE